MHLFNEPIPSGLGTLISPINLNTGAWSVMTNEGSPHSEDWYCQRSYCAGQRQFPAIKFPKNQLGGVLVWGHVMALVRKFSCASSSFCVTTTTPTAIITIVTIILSSLQQGAWHMEALTVRGWRTKGAEIPGPGSSVLSRSLQSKIVFVYLAAFSWALENLLFTYTKSSPGLKIQDHTFPAL